jgi:hypothetical protein
MLATILIVAMILLQTGALSLGLMVGRRFIIAAAGSKPQIYSTQQFLELVKFLVEIFLSDSCLNSSRCRL